MIIFLPCGLLVDNKTFSKMRDFKSLTGYTDDGGYGNRNAHVIIIIIKSKVMKSLCWLFLNCTSLRNQNGGWTVP